VSPPAPVVLVAHGSPDPRSGAAVRRLTAAVGRRWPAPVTAAFLESDRPDPVTALRALADSAGRSVVVVVVPALLTPGYHGRVDLPAVLNRSAVDSGHIAVLTPVLGPAGPGDPPAPLLLGALQWQLSALDIAYDGVVLVAAGSRDPIARSTVDDVALALSVALGLPCVAGFATGPGLDGAAAAAQVRALGARRIVAASYFLAPGRLFDIATAGARAAGALAIAGPLADAPALAELVVLRAGRDGGAPADCPSGASVASAGARATARVRVSGRGPAYLRGA
jgi:sirohydrochlorin ferrochelatase